MCAYYCVHCNGVCRCCYSIIFERLDAPRVLQFQSEGKRFAGHAICIYYTVYSWHIFLKTVETRSPSLLTLYGVGVQLQTLRNRTGIA